MKRKPASKAVLNTAPIARGHYKNDRPSQAHFNYNSWDSSARVQETLGILKELLQGLLSGLQLGFKPPEPRLAAASTLYYIQRDQTSAALSTAAIN
jgi:hypothetical protein